MLPPRGEIGFADSFSVILWCRRRSGVQNPTKMALLRGGVEGQRRPCSAYLENKFVFTTLFIMYHHHSDAVTR